MTSTNTVSTRKTPVPSGHRGLAFPGRNARPEGLLRRLTLFALRTFAAALFAVYLVWNIVWLLQGQLAPSLFLALTGFPAPTTGMTRGLRNLAHGEVWESVAWNPLAVPLLFLFLLSIAWPLVQLLRGRRLRLPPFVFHCWVFLLTLAWLIKLFGNRAYW